ncbi:NMT1/THI5 like protein [Roseisalinus antarcticus]|uniref:NMT1/THI5 like protein n=2 Tax=Roseisalinus antarcticus TaxID=254357 RepID=A0A1Y5U2G4_9RHOB|nr:NMT1/THI5 like protein [Roseisalinus antarcticus]
MTVDASAVPVFVAADRGLFGDQPVEVSQVGYEQVQALLIAGETEIGWLSPVETTSFIAEGSDLKYFSTAAALNMYNGVVVRTEDAEMYQTITDLEGKRLGIPGYGTGTWATFIAFMNAYYGIEDPDAYFDVVTASSGALLALVERGELDGALLFSGSSAAARSLPQFETIFSFTEAMQENTGQPLVITGSVATSDWLAENGEAAANVIAGLDAAVQWISENPSAFQQGGEYASLAEAAGWLSEPETTSTVLGLIDEGKWYLSSDSYTTEWMTAIRELVVAGGTLETVPTVEEIFLSPDALPAAQ